MKPRSFSWHIGMLVLGIVLPALAFIALLVVQFTASERGRIESEAQNLARILSTTLSREVNMVATTLQALATAPALDAGDLRSFHDQAVKLRGQQDINFSLRNSDGVSLMATRLPFGQQILNNPPEVVAADRIAMQERRANLSNVFIGPVTGKPAIQIMVPVLGEEPVRLVVGASLEPEFFHDILERFDRGPGWVAAILDRNSVFASREPGHEAFAGKSASPDFLRQGGADKGLYYGVNAEGVPSLVAYEMDLATGWRTSVSLATSIINQQLRWSVLQLLGAGLLLTLIGMGLATLVNRRLTGSMVSVSGLASAIRDGRPIRAAPIAVTDVAEIGRVLQGAADEARSSLGRLRRVLDNLHTFVGLLDLDGKLVEVNNAPLALAGLAREAVLGRSFWETPWWSAMPDEQQRIEAACRAAMEGETVRFDIDVRAAEGRIITIDFQISPLRDEAGQIVGLQPSGIDITARVAAQAELAGSARRSRFVADLRDRLDQEADPAGVLKSAAAALMEHMAIDSVSIHEVDKARGEVVVHQAGSRPGLASGPYPLADVYAPRTQALLEAEEVVAVDDVRTDPITQDRAHIFESFGMRSCIAVPLSRRGRWVGALTLAHGGTRSWSGDIDFLRNIAERVWIASENARLMQELARSEERLQIGVAVAGLGLGRMDYRADTITLDDKAAELFALPAGVAIPRADVHARFHPDDAPELLPQIARLVGEEGDGFMAVEHRVLHPDGSVIWLLARKQVTYEADEGRRCAAAGILAVHDITARKLAEEALQRSEERLAISQEAASVASWEWSPLTGVASFSANARSLWGFEDDWTFEIEGWLELIHPDDRQAVADGLRAARDDASLAYEAEFRVRRKDGGWRWLLGKGRAVGSSAGEARRLAGINMDVTDRKELEERQRLLVRELHHRVKNSLATVQAIASTSLRSAKSIEEFREGFAARLDSLSRTHSLLTENVWTAIDLMELLRAEVAPYAEGDRISLDGPPVRLPAQMALALGMGFHELATNAAKHGSLSSPQGRLTVSWSVAPDAQGRVLTIDWRESGGPPVASPAETGFGTRLLSRILGPQIHGRTKIAFVETGLEARIEAPLPEVLEEEFETARSGHEAGIDFT